MPNVQLQSKYSDIVALDTGDKSNMRLNIDDTESLLNKYDLQSKEKQVALVLGGNGFVGCHMIASLLDHARISKVIAIVRPQKGVSATERVKNALESYGLSVNEKHFAKLDCLTGHYNKPGFGVSAGIYEELSNIVDIIYHCAGTHDFEMSYTDYRVTHVLSFLQLFEFCIKGQPKQIHYVSSATVNFFKEPHDFARKDSWWFSGYSQMKWVNTTMLLDAFSQGIAGSVYVPASYILGPISTGNNPGRAYSLWRVAKLCEDMGKVWNGFEFQCVTADVLADIVIENSLSRKSKTYVPITFNKMTADQWATVLNCTQVSWEDFIESIPQAFGNRRKREAAEALLTEDLLEASDKILIDESDPDLVAPADQFPSSYEAVQSNWQFLQETS